MTTQTEVRPTRPRPQLRKVTVARVAPLTPRMVRITLAGVELSGFTRAGVAGRVRVWIPNADGELAYHGALPDDTQVPPERRSPTRVYTPRRWNPERFELDLDIVLHGSGPLSTWAAGQTRRPRRRGRPGGVYTISMDADWYLIAGDETAVPAISTILEGIDPVDPGTGGHRGTGRNRRAGAAQPLWHCSERISLALAHE
jgi:NADPH-dependent ferric siderophore reductase